MFNLYKNNKLILTATYWEDLVDFVNILKKYNKNFINRKEFIVKCNNDVMYSWKKK